MRNTVVWFIALSFIVTCASQAQAWPFGEKTKQTQAQSAVSGQGASGATQDQSQASGKAEAPKKAPSPAQADKAAADALAANRALIAKKKQALNNTEWQITITNLTTKGKEEPDEIIFTGNQVKCVGMAKRGFSETNYTLTVQEDGSLVWETMQSSEEAGTAFWRGEIDSSLQTMHGALSYQPDSETTVDYMFASASKKSIPPQEKAAEPAQEKTPEKAPVKK